jgi:hypothetical protein
MDGVFRNVLSIAIRKYEEKRQFMKLRVDVKTVIKLILHKKRTRACTEFIWFRIHPAVVIR